MFGSKLADVQNNEAASWLPATAESTRALEKLAPFQDPNAIPTLVVYEKTSGLTPEDLAAAKAQATEIQQLDGVEGEVLGPFPSADGEALQTAVTFNFGKNGWEDMPDAASALQDIAQIDGADVYIAGAGGQAADSFEAFSGIDSTLLLATLSVVLVLMVPLPLAADVAGPDRRGWSARGTSHGGISSAPSRPNSPVSGRESRAS